MVKVHEKIKRVGGYKGYSIYQDQEGSLGVMKNGYIVPLMRQTESGAFIPLTYSDLFFFKEEGNLKSALLDLENLCQK